MSDDAIKRAEREWQQEQTPEAAARYVHALGRSGTRYSAVRNAALLDKDAIFVMETEHADLFDDAPDYDKPVDESTQRMHETFMSLKRQSQHGRGGKPKPKRSRLRFESDETLWRKVNER